MIGEQTFYSRPPAVTMAEHCGIAGCARLRLRLDGRGGRRHMMHFQARVSCRVSVGGAIWISGLTGACRSSSIFSASLSLYVVNSVAFTVARNPPNELNVAFT